MFDVDQFLATISKIQGAPDMLRESAKQFRNLDNDGFAVMADRHADELEKIGAQRQIPQAETDAAFRQANLEIDKLLN